MGQNMVTSKWNPPVNGNMDQNSCGPIPGGLILTHAQIGAAPKMCGVLCFPFKKPRREWLGKPPGRNRGLLHLNGLFIILGVGVDDAFVIMEPSFVFVFRLRSRDSEHILGWVDCGVLVEPEKTGVTTPKAPPLTRFVSSSRGHPDHLFLETPACGSIIPPGPEM